MTGDPKTTDRPDERTAEDDLLAAFLFCGWTAFMPIAEAEAVAHALVQSDERKAWKLGGILLRGEDMPLDIVTWVRDAGCVRRGLTHGR